MNLYLVRHTESKAQTEEEYSLDANLSGFGVRQAKCLQNVLPNIPFDKVILSPLKRARQTFEHSGVKCNNICFDSRLVEELPSGMYADNILPYEQTPAYGAEDCYDAWEKNVDVRVASFLESVYSITDCENVLIVCHAGVLNWIIQLFLNPGITANEMGVRPKCHMDNGAISVIKIDSHRQNRFLKWNDTAHL